MNVAQDAYNARYTAGKAPSKRFSAAISQQIKPPEDANADGALARSSIAGSRRNSGATGGASVRASVSGPSRKTSSSASTRKNSASGISPGFDFSKAILDGSLTKSLAKGSVVGKSRRASSVAADVQQPAGDLIERASILAENNAEILAQQALDLAENNADILAERASVLAENTADVLAQRASILAENTAEALVDTASILADSIPQRASMIAQNSLEMLPQRASLIAQRNSIRRASGYAPEDLIDTSRLSMRRISGEGGSRRSSTVLASKRPSTAALPFFMQDPEDPNRRSSLVRQSLALGGSQRRNSSKSLGSR